MLTVTFNLRDGTFSDIPDDAHELIIEDYDKLTPQSANFIKTLHYQTSIRYFITTCYSFISTYSLNMIKKLETFVKESKAYHPQFHNIICGWCFIVLMFAFTHLLVLSRFRRITIPRVTLVN